MMTELSINIIIGHRTYPMKVAVAEEAMIREVGKKINEQLKSFQQQFDINDIQDLLAMVAIDSFVKHMKELRQSRDEIALNQITSLSRLISTQL